MEDGTSTIANSTLSRHQTGQRRASLELLLPPAQTYGVSLDDRVGAPEAGDPEFDTRVPHWLGSTGDEPADLRTFGPQGERARPSEDHPGGSSRGMRSA